MDWDNLKFFLVLRDQEPLARFRVDHSTVARRIDMLWQELGIRLVEWLSRSYRLTAEGERVRDRAKEVDAGIAEIARFAHSVDRSPTRVGRVKA
jgi:DNA-binding transcriptional LysR family regulator